MQITTIKHVVAGVFTSHIEQRPNYELFIAVTL